MVDFNRFMVQPGISLSSLIPFISCAHFAYASTSTSDFSKAAFAARSAGFPSLSDASTQLFSALFHDGPQAALNCVLKGSKPKSSSGIELTHACEYISWIAFWFLFALVLAILLFVVCMGFCFGRWCCKCCCKPCSLEACGGNKPTVTYTTGWAIFHSVVYISVLILFFSLTIVGVLCFMDTSTAITGMGKESLSSLSYISRLLNEIGPNILGLSPIANSIASSLNQRLDGIAVVNASATAFVQSLVTTDSQIQKLQFFVEGCKSSVPMCSSQQNPAGWNQCANGAHTTGIGAVMSSGKTNPACRDQSGYNKTCPCCSNCSITRALLSETKLGVPTSWARLDKRISTTEIDGYLKDASTSINDLVNPLQKFVLDTKENVNRFFATVEDNKSLRIGVSVAVWAPGWAIATFALLGIFLASYSESPCALESSLAHPGNIGHCLHWTAFSMAVFWVAFVTLPLFAVLSIVSLPLADLCRLVPRTGEDPSRFLEIFSASDPDVSAAFRRCVLAPDGSILDQRLKDKVNETFDSLRVVKNRIPKQTIVDYLSAQGQSAPFVRAQGWLKGSTVADKDFQSVSNCSQPACVPDFDTYRSDLQNNLDSISAASDSTRMNLDSYINAASALQQNILLMDSDVEVGITTLRCFF